mgnify:CR=1 FL=1
MSKICTIAWVHGMVQGVGFRYSTQREAMQLGLTGYARNRMMAALRWLPVVMRSRLKSWWRG